MSARLLTGRSRRRPRAAVLVVCLLALATGCNRWAGVGYGAARTSHNPTEHELGVDEVDELVEVWSAPVSPGTGQPLIVDGRVLVAADQVQAFDLAGVSGCSGVPTVCAPTWRSSVGGASWVTEAAGVVYAAGAGWLRAYDAAGVTGCSGTPTVCEPLWSAPIGSGGSSPAVSQGRVYVSGDLLYAFDAAGVAGCSGTPTVCEPLWRSSVAASDGAAVSGGVAYAITGATLSAFDAAGVAGCSGTPTACDPLRTYDGSDDCFPYGCVPQGPPTVAQGQLFVLVELCCSGGLGAVHLHAFDALGVLGCAGTPVVCEPTGTTSIPSQGLPYAQPPVAVADGVAYAGALGVTAVDAATLTTSWRTAGGLVASAPSVADGVVHLVGLAPAAAGGFGLVALAHDAAGSVGCTGTPPLCDPLWSSPAPTAPVDLVAVAQARVTGPAVAEGHVAVRTDRLQVLTRP